VRDQCTVWIELFLSIAAERAILLRAMLSGRLDFHKYGNPGRILLIFHKDCPEYKQEDTDEDSKDSYDSFQEYNHIGKEDPYRVRSKKEEKNTCNKTYYTWFIHSDHILSAILSIFEFIEDKRIDSRRFPCVPSGYRRV